MPLYCPNCSALVSEAETVCRNCGAMFGTGSAWRPTERPIETEDPLTDARPAGLSGKVFYGFVVVVMLLALVAQFLAAPLEQVFPPTRGATFSQALQVFLSISMILHPVPAMFRGALPYLVAATLFWFQVVLLIRRTVICV